MKKKNRLIFVLIGLVVIVGALALNPLFSHDDIGAKNGDAEAVNGNAALNEPDIVSIDIACVGDIMTKHTALQIILNMSRST